MDYKNIIIIGLILLMLTVFGLLQAFDFSFFKTPTAKIHDKTFKLDVAKSDEQKQIGLSKFKSIPLDRGMLFLFDKPSLYSFWMKDMKFPIDIIFINQDKIVTIHQNLPTNNLTIYSSTENADRVLEINANLSRKYGFSIGDSVVFKNLK